MIALQVRLSGLYKESVANACDRKNKRNKKSLNKQYDFERKGFCFVKNFIIYSKNMDFWNRYIIIFYIAPHLAFLSLMR